jgi:hypothetical protein
MTDIFRSIIQLGKSKMKGNFSEVAIIVLSKLHWGILKWRAILVKSSSLSFKNCPSLGCLLEITKILTKIFAPVWDVCFCHEVAKILPKILPQFKIFDPDLENLRGSCPTVNARKMSRVLFSQCCFKAIKFILFFCLVKRRSLALMVYAHAESMFCQKTYWFQL